MTGTKKYAVEITHTYVIEVDDDEELDSNSFITQDIAERLPQESVWQDGLIYQLPDDGDVHSDAAHDSRAAAINETIRAAMKWLDERIAARMGALKSDDRFGPHKVDE